MGTQNLNISQSVYYTVYITNENIFNGHGILPSGSYEVDIDDNFNFFTTKDAWLTELNTLGINTSSALYDVWNI